MTIAVVDDQTRGFDAIVVHTDDDVAVALRDFDSGDVVRVRLQNAIRSMPLRDAVPLGHKFALHPIAEGAEVRKYGESIGAATCAIAEGAHVHVHNIASRRGRPG